MIQRAGSLSSVLINWLNLSRPIGQSETSNDQANRKFWKALWSLNVPNKVKSFAWRASKNILPTKANLGHQRVLDDPTCEACGVAVESSGHFFWDCDKASEIWKLSGIPFDAREAHFQDFKDLLWHVM